MYDLKPDDLILQKGIDEMVERLDIFNINNVLFLDEEQKMNLCVSVNESLLGPKTNFNFYVYLLLF